MVGNIFSPMIQLSGPGCSKLMTSLVNVLLTFQISQAIFFFFFFEKMCDALQKLLSFCQQKISVFGCKVVKHLTSWPLNELVKLMGDQVKLFKERLCSAGLFPLRVDSPPTPPLSLSWKGNRKSQIVSHPSNIPFCNRNKMDYLLFYVLFNIRMMGRWYWKAVCNEILFMTKKIPAPQRVSYQRSLISRPALNQLSYRSSSRNIEDIWLF